MLPLPSLSFTGGAGGAATAGTQSGSNAPQSVGFGSFQVGGKGNTGGGGTATATATPQNPMLWIGLAAAAGLALVLFLVLRK